jgi:hypothetical protein
MIMAVLAELTGHVSNCRGLGNIWEVVGAYDNGSFQATTKVRIATLEAQYRVSRTAFALGCTRIQKDGD